jgi:hypothetical protein
MNKCRILGFSSGRLWVTLLAQFLKELLKIIVYHIPEFGAESIRRKVRLIVTSSNNATISPLVAFGGFMSCLDVNACAVSIAELARPKSVTKVFKSIVAMT